MGLDMYLRKHIYVGAKWDMNKVKGEINLTSDDKPINVNLKKVSYIVEEAGYWRKANQIHKWFVDNVQGGEDECKEHEVSYEQLQELKTLCLQVLDTKDTSKLPPQSGFFFGSMNVDEGYWEDLQDTIKIIDSLDSNGEYYYQSSW